MNPLLTWSTHTILKHHQQAHCVLGFCLVQKWFCTPHHGFWGFWIRLCGGRKAMDHVKHMIPYRANKLIVFCWWYASAGELHLPTGPTELWFFSPNIGSGSHTQQLLRNAGSFSSTSWWKSCTKISEVSASEKLSGPMVTHIHQYHCLFCWGTSKSL
jgi:hypothetical protein